MWDATKAVPNGTVIAFTAHISKTEKLKSRSQKRTAKTEGNKEQNNQ